MFYYAEINSEYQVINKHCLSEESTNPNYILITENLYNNGNELGDIVGQFYNTLSNVIEIVDPYWDMGQTCWMRYKDSQMRLSTKLDNMDKTTSLKADINHTHTGYANSDDLQELEDAIATKANANHSHTEYASVSHTHNNYATQVALDSLSLEIDGKADASHTHSGYSTTTHNHDSSYSPLSHSHTASEIGAATSGHNHDSVYATITSLDELSSIVSGKASASHTHVVSDVTGLQTALDSKANLSHGTHVSYSTTAPVMDGTASVGLASTVARSDHKHPTDTSRAAQTSLDSHTSNKSNPHGVTLAQLGVTSTAAELNALDGVTATVTELNYVDGVTSNIQTQLNGKAASSHTHSYAGSSSVGGAATSANKLNTNAGSATQPVYFANGVPVATTYTLGKSVPSNAVFTDTTYGNATTSNSGLMSSDDKTKLDGIATGANNYTLPSAGSALGGVKSGGDVTISSGVITVNDDSHNHTIANVDGLQTALDGKSATSHNHNNLYISKNLQITSDGGDVSVSFSGQNVVTAFSGLASGMYTAYSPLNCEGNPNTTEGFRFMIHKVGATTYGWIMAHGTNGSVYNGYLNGGVWSGWKCLYEANPSPLWTGGANGGYYMTAGHTVTPSKKLSECRAGWILLWSDYDVGGQANNTDFCTTVIPKRAYTGQIWNGAEWYCDVPTYSAGTATDSEQRVIKLLQIYDTKIVGTANNAAAPRNDVVLRAVYEF